MGWWGPSEGEVVDVVGGEVYVGTGEVVDVVGEVKYMLAPAKWNWQRNSPRSLSEV